MKPVYYLMPFICAAIGWGTNYLAIKMLFRPHRVFNIFGFKLQGILPKRQSQIAEAVGEAIEKELVRKEDLEVILKGAGKERLTELIDKIIDKRLRLYKLNSIYLIDKLHKRTLGFLKSFTRKGIINSLEKQSEFSADLVNNINVRGLVRERINSFSTEELEKATFLIMNKELRFVEIMGAVIGFFVGTFQMVFYIL